MDKTECSVRKGKTFWQAESLQRISPGIDGPTSPSRRLKVRKRKRFGGPSARMVWVCVSVSRGAAPCSHVSALQSEESKAFDRILKRKKRYHRTGPWNATSCSALRTPHAAVQDELYLKERSRTMSKTKFLLLSLVAIVGITFGAIWAFNTLIGSIPYSTPETPKRDPAELKAACEQHVREADRKAAEAVAKRSREFAAFIESKKAGAKPFSEDIVSLYGKWRAVKPYLPFTQKNGHKEYIEEKFAQHIFSKSDFAIAVRLAIAGTIKDIESIENELAVALRQEVLGRSLAPDEIPIVEEGFKKAIEQLVTASQFDAAKSVGSLIVAEIAGSFVTQVMIRLGVSAGIIATGAANSSWSLGVSIVIGVILGWVWEWIDDPKGDIEREIKIALDRLSSQASTAINEEMNKVVMQRSGLWTKTIEGIVP